jgi:hypothetical protein
MMAANTIKRDHHLKKGENMKETKLENPPAKMQTAPGIVFRVKMWTG